MKKIITLNIFIVIALGAALYAAYVLLLHDTFLHASIAGIMAKSHNLEFTQHLVVLGLLPIYIAAVIFGLAILGIYLGGYIQQFLIRRLKKPQLS
jgi:hypothetical protein